ncbi:MAG TPA: FRG domain-containing protein, partial [Blastocatellia bacterium]|nr:FRG domain-containing protein [Blastocatellia bacterium]
ARFISHIKQNAASELGADVAVYLRGQSEDHAGIVPSLFRQANPGKAKRRLQAYDHVCEQLAKLSGLKRFRRPNLGSLLQHYGVHTPWLDLVDNLFVGVWFATHIYDRAAAAWQRSNKEFGWIHMIGTRDRKGLGLIVSDLRIQHHPLSVRLHAQLSQ